MIGLSAPTVDETGAVVLTEHKGKSQTSEPPARLSKSQCLDGTVSLTHSGVADGDRTFKIVIPQITEAAYTVVKRLHRNYTTITIACSEGVFAGAIAEVRASKGDCTITIEITEKLNTD